ncbi:MAG: BACON domain-containing protein [Alistipes sp.]|nr:BACON domain-containing protein [Alistipes sp.]
MKRIFTIFTIAMLALAACEPTDEPGNQNGNNNQEETPGGNENENPGDENSGNEDTDAPGVKVTSNLNPTIGPGNVTGIISYELINPVEGMTVEATASVDWLGEFNYQNMGKISYKARRNNTPDLRAGVITITYGESSVDVNITQEGNPDPTDVDVKAPILTGHYYGADPNWDNLYNYYLAFSDKGFSSNEAIYGHDYDNVPDAYYYFVDLYVAPDKFDESNPYKVPKGTYQLDKASQGWPNMFMRVYSWMQYNNAEGYQSSSTDQVKYDEGELIVDDGKVTLNVTMTISNIEEKHTVIYEGDYTLIDMSGISYYM